MAWPMATFAATIKEEAGGVLVGREVDGVDLAPVGAARGLGAQVGDGQEVTIRGWLHNRRSSGKIHFLVLRDGTEISASRRYRERLDALF